MRYAIRTQATFRLLSSGTFTDLLAEMSYVVDVGEQDKALAQAIARDQEILQSLHQAVTDTRTQTDALRIETKAQKATLDKSLKALKAAKAQLAKLEKQVQQYQREEKGLRPGGLGLMMSKALVDEVIYNEKRNEVVLVKYLD